MSSQSRGFLASPEGLKLLQAAKAERGWTFAAIAQRAGVSADTVSRLFHPERGKRVSEESVRAIAGVLGVEVDAIALEGEWSNPLVEAERRIQKALKESKTTLNLSDLGLEELPESLKNLASLEILHLDGNQLKILPEFIGDLSKLRALHIEHNNLKTLPESLGRLDKLRILSIAMNRLEKLPDSLEKMTELVELNLRANKISSLPENLGLMRNLKSLLLPRNLISQMPNSMRHLTTLEELNIGSNEFAGEFPCVILEIKSLRSLNLVPDGRKEPTIEG